MGAVLEWEVDVGVELRILFIFSQSFSALSLFRTYCDWPPSPSCRFLGMVASLILHDRKWYTQTWAEVMSIYRQGVLIYCSSSQYLGVIVGHFT